MTRPIPTRVMHFTHVRHLPTIVRRGLVADTAARSAGLLTVEVGNQGIKEGRRRRPVPIAPGGVVADLPRLDDAVDWELMTATMWKNTPEQPDRRERRMAECLIHERVPWQAFTEVVARTRACAVTARAALTTVGTSTPVVVRPDWYS